MATKKQVYGVGINDADYVTQVVETVGYVGGEKKQKLVWRCPYYRTWKHMLERCYSTNYQERKPTYMGCSVAKEWLTFSNFKNWMEKQNWEGMCLDKDLLFGGNKVYGPETCVFVTQLVNSFIVDNRAARGKWMVGVCWNKERGKFQSNCRNPITKKREYLGLFDSEQEAHNAWLKRKLELAHELAATQSDSRVAKALIDRYSNYKNNG